MGNTNLRIYEFKNLRIFLLLLTPIFFYSFIPIYAGVTKQKTTVNRYDLSPSMSIRVSAQVGGYLFDLQGLTSPWAKVEFYSTEGNVDVVTLADDQGVFHFRNVLAPIQTGDFCFISYDTNGTANNPLCFSPPPPKTKTTIKDIVLSPTLVLDKGLFRQGEMVSAAGRTFPNAEIRIYMFEENRPFWLDLIDVIIPKTFAREGNYEFLGWWPSGLLRGVRPAFAREGPQLTINADPDGDFSFNLPTQKSNLWRMFAGPKFKGENMTAKSNILEFSALSWLEWIIFQILRILYQVQTKIFKLLLNWWFIFGFLIALIVAILAKLARSRSGN